MSTDLDLATLVTTRRALHGLAELVLAGPQYRRSETIRLRVLPGGFGTVGEPDLRIEGVELVAADRRLPLSDTTYGALGTAAGVTAGAPDGVYKGGSKLRLTDPLMVDGAAAELISRSFDRADEALRRFTRDAAPVLWPEHFDLAVTSDEVTFGVSPGDDYIPDPYAYAGPWRARAGTFWNAPFGAARPLRLLPGATAIHDFFMEAAARAATDLPQTP